MVRRACLDPKRNELDLALFSQESKEWAGLRDMKLDQPGHVCFAEEQISLWKELVFWATKDFIDAGVMCEAIALPNQS